ncbi:DUF2092 domain-containing protein [Sphaerisporangium album]|uniref:DUF2092 domain-containing protein n=1 Tax=Sphaerisporangium album TaxID=509200 RepID=A0A367FUN0_9ACTN|nr:DUF2092 domain-containing protein [Sphaerisporangium album]RCG33305.1 DUF2092 domain-containing protein [Sphaerisporangium album]
MQSTWRRARAVRWAVPVAAFVVVGAAVGAGPVIAAVQGDPALPDRTAAQLLAEVAKTAQHQQPPAMSGTVVETASLGLPSLPLPSGTSSSPLSLLSGSHTLKVWYGGDGRLRLALPGQMSETDVISDGKGSAWLWESATNTVTRFTLPEGVKGDKGKEAEAAHTALPTATTPQDLADRLLKAADESTAVTVENGQHIAGRAAYQLVLTPKDSTSLVDRVTLALDGETYIPLRVQIFAKGAAEPAFEVGFTQVSFSAPAPENFAFTPPAGAKVKEQKPEAAKPGEPWSKDGAAGHAAPGAEAARAGARTHGSGWGTVAEVPFSLADLSKQQNGPRGGGDPAQMIESVLKSAKQVSGTWGSGKVITTKLVSVLLTDDGRLFAGAVTPEALVQAAGRK